MRAKDAQHLHRVAALSCIACRSMGYNDMPAEIHHPRAGVGMGKRASHADAIPLCHAHAFAFVVALIGLAISLILAWITA